MLCFLLILYFNSTGILLPRNRANDQSKGNIRNFVVSLIRRKKYVQRIRKNRIIIEQSISTKRPTYNYLQRYRKKLIPMIITF